jgi:hypothetical protein
MGTGTVFLYILSAKSIKSASTLRTYFPRLGGSNTVPNETKRRKDFFFQIYILLLPLAFLYFSYYHSKLVARFLNSYRLKDLQGIFCFQAIKLLQHLLYVCVCMWFSKDHVTNSY